MKAVTSLVKKLRQHNSTADFVKQDLQHVTSLNFDFCCSFVLIVVVSLRNNPGHSDWLLLINKVDVGLNKQYLSF